MGSEALLYIYGFVCLSMIAFNIVYNIIMRGSDERMKQRVARYDKIITEELNKIRRGSRVTDEHIKHMTRLLSKTSGLMAFDAALDRHFDSVEKNAAGEYLNELAPVFIELAYIYGKRENLQAAYFAYFIGSKKLKDHVPADDLQNILIEYMDKDSLYCRVNTMHALYAFGSAKTVVDAVSHSDRNGAFLHDKILQDGLLMFEGDHHELIKLLWRRFDDFSEETRVAILNYIRFENGEYQREMLDIMLDENRGKELRLAAVRYFAKYPYEPAKEKLLEFGADTDPVHWEYAAIGATALASYDGDDVIKVLTDAMLSQNWHVRYNAALSLEAKGIEYSDIEHIVGGDRYAKEMLAYRLGSERDEEEEEERKTVLAEATV